MPKTKRSSSSAAPSTEAGSEPAAPAAGGRRRADAIALAAMILGVLAVYFPLEILDGEHSLLGLDFNCIHVRRIRFVQEYFAAHGASLPGWYPREIMGTPFWSNIQSFPFLPTRLLLLGIDAGVLFPVAVNLAAVLAALFTYLFLRRLALAPIACAVGGWTFAASGFFASRVMAGHLPLLEAFGALPLLLWLVESLAQTPRDDSRRWRWFAALALAALCVVLAGHPQVPTYAMGVAVVYAVVRGVWKLSYPALACGVGLSGFVWWPMLRLIGRSTRILPLDPPGNDLAFPYWRLKAFLFPWADGWPPFVLRTPLVTFTGHDYSYFWDTVCYVGWIPLLAAAFLGVRAIRRFRGGGPILAPDRRWVCIAVLGILALAVALPFTRAITSEFKVTLLRSPSRLLYVTTFALAAAAAVGIDQLWRAGARSTRGFATTVACVLVGVHVLDLGIHDKAFVKAIQRDAPDPPSFSVWRKTVGDLRYGFDYALHAPGNRAVDDVGFFDSIMLARPYRALIAMSGGKETLNVQTLDGSDLPPSALAGLCAEGIVTRNERPDLPVQKDLEFGKVYTVPDPARRAVFLPDSAVTFLEDADVLMYFRNGIIDLKGKTYLAPSAKPSDFEKDARATEPAEVAYDRPDWDEVLLGVENRVPGYVRLMETWDEGWTAVVDGKPADLLVADTFAMAVRLSRGKHLVRLSFKTPGAGAGLWISAASAVLLALGMLRIRAASIAVRTAS